MSPPARCDFAVGSTGTSFAVALVLEQLWDAVDLRPHSSEAEQSFRKRQVRIQLPLRAPLFLTKLRSRRCK